MAVCWGPGRPATTVVMLDERGELIDSLYTGFLGSKGIGGPQAHQRWEEDKRKLEEFIKEHQPHMAVIGAANLRCKNLFDDVNQVGVLDHIFILSWPTCEFVRSCYLASERTGQPRVSNLLEGGGLTLAGCSPS